MRHFIALLLLLLCTSQPAWALSLPTPGSATPETVKPPSGPSSVKGLTDMPEISGFNGLAKQRISVPLPATRAGFRPRVVIEHDGGLGNSVVGVGWLLNTAVIRRMVRLGVPRYDESDTLELLSTEVSGRLVAVSDSEWRVEARGNEYRVVRDGAGFRLDSPNGRQAWLGTREGSRTESDGRVAEWWINDEADVAHQTVVYSYEKPSSRPLLRTIAWGPDALFQATFGYEVREDQVVSFATGFRVETAERLRSIAVESAKTLRQTLWFGYEDAFPLSRLATVDASGFLGRGRWPRTTFTYVRQKEPGAPQALDASGWVLNRNGANLADINGDGLPDLYRAVQGSHSFRRNLGQGRFASAQDIPAVPGAELGRMRLMDVDGDARPELFVAVGNRWTMRSLVSKNSLLSTWGRATNVSGSENVALLAPHIVFADVNGDGRTDTLEAVSDRIRLRLMGNGALQPPLERKAISASNPRVLPGNNHTLFTELNGDGIVDVLWLGNDKFEVYLGAGDGTFVREGDRFAYPWNGELVDEKKLLVADFNRDGLIDLAHVTAADVAYYASVGGFRFAPARRLPRPETSDADATVAFADGNGNATLDLIWSSPSGMWGLEVVGDGAVGLLESIDNGTGARSVLSYSTSGELLSTSSKPWQNVIATSLPVISVVTMTPFPQAPARVTSYEPRDAYWDVAERQFVGYGQSTIKQQPGTPDVLQTTEHYELGLDDRRVLRGRVIESMLQNGDGASFQRTRNTYEALVVAGGAHGPLGRRPFLKEELLFVSELTTHTLQTKTLHEPDAQGRDVKTTEEGRMDLTGDERIVTRGYADGETPWVRDFLYEEKTFSGARLERSVRTYAADAARAELTLGKPGNGWQAREELAKGERWVTTSAWHFDAWGNTVDTTVDGVSHVFAYDPLSLSVVGETLSPTSSRKLRWTAHWDVARGIVDRMTGPDGVTLLMVHDDCGRLSSVARYGHRPHLYYDYAFDSNGWRVVTEEFDGDPDAVPARGEGEAWSFETSVHDGLGDLRFAAQRLDTKHWIITQWTERNGAGLPVREFSPFHHDGAALPAEAPANADAETKSYDAQGRLRQQTFPNGHQRGFKREPFTETISASELTDTVVKRDGLGRIVTNTRYLDQQRVKKQVTRATYDSGDRPLSIRFVGGPIHRFDYDELGRLRRVSDPDSGVRTYELGDDGRMKTARNAAGESVSYGYDDIGRPTTIQASTGERYVYHYDAAPDGERPGCLGRVCWIEEPSGRVLFDYDTQGNVTEFDREVNGHREVERKLYGASGLLRRVAWDGGPTLDLVHDRAGRLSAISNLLAITQRDAAGRILVEKAGNGVTSTFTYDLSGLPKSATVKNAKGALLDREGQRYSFGAMRSATDHLAKTETTFVADEVGRLSSMSIGPKTLSYGYDALDNMVQRLGGPSASANGTYRNAERGRGPRQLTTVAGGVGDLSLDYDAAGRVKRLGDTTLAYDAFDHLVSARRSDGASTFVYGYDGLVVSTDQGATRQWTPWLVERQGHKYYYVADGTRLIARLAGEPVRLGSASGTSVAGASFRRTEALYFHTDFTAGPVLITDAAGERAALRQFDPFGAPMDDGVDFNVEPRNSLNKDVDPKTGFSRHGNRWLSTQTARWLTPDPAVRNGHPDWMLSPWQLHPYDYVGQNPTYLWDDNGDVAQVVAGAGVGCVMGLGIYAINTLRMGQEVTARGAIAAALGGAVAGSVVASGPIGWMASGVLGGATQRSVETGSVSATLAPDAVIVDAGTGLLGGGFFKGAGALAKPAIAPLAKAVAPAVKSAFGTLSRAAQFGIKPYNQLRAAVRGMGLQVHHLIEQRFAKLFGIKPRDGLSVAVTGLEHQNFTNAWRKEIGYGSAGTGRATSQSVRDAAKDVYNNFPALLKAALNETK